ncbi:MAG: hypothetical protein Q9161_004041 [Pseudevernia consocians]
MVSRKTRTPASDRVSTHRAPKKHPRNISSSPSSTPPSNVTQPTQQTSQGQNITRSTPVSEWTSAFGLDQPDIDRAAISSFSSSKRNTKASPETVHTKKIHNPPASIMTQFHGVPVYSHPPFPHPTTSTAGSAIGLPSILSKDHTPPFGKIILPKLDPALRHNPSAYLYSHLTKPAAPPSQRPPANNNTPQEPPPFEPRKCHWRALRDVAFVLDGGMKLSVEDLCALLRFRYAKDDPLMARVETAHVGAMYAFCKGLRQAMYEETAGGLIKWQMARDLKLMREGGVGVVSEDF